VPSKWSHRVEMRTLGGGVVLVLLHFVSLELGGEVR